MTTFGPAVSVIIPTYNRAELLPRALDSVVGQTYTDWEIVLIDDGSTDETSDVVRDYADRLGERLVAVRQSNKGSSASRNRGIEVSRGRFVAFLDSDDEFLPTKLERQLTLFDRRPELGLVYSDYAYVDLEGVRHESVLDTNCRLARTVPHEVVEPGLCVCGPELFDFLLREYFIATIVGLVRRGVLGETIRFPVGRSYAEEWFFYLQVARSCPVGFVNEPLCLHHHVKGSLSRADSRQNTRRMYDILVDVAGAFDDLTRAQRRTIRHNLADTCLQLGYDAYRDGRFKEATNCFAAALRRKPRGRTASALVRSVLAYGNGCSKRRSSSTTESQDTAQPVR